MRKPYVVGLVLVVICGFVVWRFIGMGSSGPEGTIKEMISTMNQLADTLESVKDDASAGAAIPKIESAGKKLAALVEQMQAHKLSKEEDKKLGEKYEKEMAAAVSKIKDATTKAVQKVPGKVQQLADALFHAGQLYVSLDLFEVTETTDPDGARANQLSRDRILSGRNYIHPAELRRLATTYYHRRGPVGVVLEKFNWFPGPANTYSADVRLPACLVALAAGDALGGSPVPLGLFVGVWSEPPIGVIELNVGTMASYGRPFQHLHFYDKSARLKDLVDPAEGKPRPFHYLHDARQRGCALAVLIGDVRPTLERQGPDQFYHMLIVEPTRGSEQDLEAGLLTKEAMTLYFKKLTEQGILCVHVSNRHLDLASVVADVAHSLGFAYRRGHDTAPEGEKDRSHFASEWVVVSRKEEHLQHLQAPPGYARDKQFWTRLTPSGRPVWNDADINALERRK